MKIQLNLKSKPIRGTSIAINNYIAENLSGGILKLNKDGK